MLVAAHENSAHPPSLEKF